MNSYLILSTTKTAMQTKISELLTNLSLWRILGFASSIVGFTCFAMSPSFYDLFGRWNLFKSAIYSIISLSVITMMLFVKKCTRFTRSVMVNAHVGFLVMMLTSLCSIWQDRVSEKENDEKGWRGRILNMCSFGAFGFMSLSLSRQLELGFVADIFNFLFGSFLVLLMKMDFKLAPVAAILCFIIINIQSFSDYFMKKLGYVHSSHAELPEDIESGSRTNLLQPMNVVAESMYKNRLQQHAQSSRIPLPIYQAVNLGLDHDPRYRAAVSIDGKSYASRNVFPNLGASEQDVARLALKHLTTGVKDEGLSLILEGSTSFKSILNDYANKMNLEHTYDPVQREGLTDFKSSLNLNGEHYVGDRRKTKKQAKQSAACAAVLSNLKRFLL